MNPHIVVSLSGGKDSTATGLYLRRLGIPFSWVFADTGWESPITYEYVDRVLPELFGPGVHVRMPTGPLPPVVDDDGRELLDVESLALTVEACLPERARPSPMVRRILGSAMFPSRVFRWCTEHFKWDPIVEHFRSFGPEAHVVNVIGVRREESAARASVPEWDAHPSNPARWLVWAPLFDWTEADVIAEHHRAGIVPNRLYFGTSQRVGCWPCVFAGKADLRALSLDADRVEAIRRLERAMEVLYAVKARKRGRAPTFFPDPAPEKQRRGLWRCESDACVRGKLRSAPGVCEVCGEALIEYVSRAYRPMPIDQVMAWGLSDRGGQQALFGPDPEGGCHRWGMCDAAGGDR